MEEKDWMVQINDELRSNGPSVPEMEQLKRHSIYKVPLLFTKHNKNAYTPNVVSFGPYHHGEEHLKAMEVHKHRALIHFLKRCKKAIELLFQRMDQVVQELRDAYNPLDPIWMHDTPKFLQMMILDGCFMLEILRANESVPDDYADNDPVFGKHGKLYVMPRIKRDMLMLENQLPIKVLHTLIEVETTSEQDDELLNKRILEFLDNPPKVSIGKCMHVLDVYRKSLIRHEPSHPTCEPKDSVRRKFFPRPEPVWLEFSVRELHEAGIRFKSSETNSLKDVSFHGGKLSLPYMQVNENTEYEFLNLIAFEHLHVGAGNEVTAYAYFMYLITFTEKDVELLQKNGILINGLESHKHVVKLFNFLVKDITMNIDDLGVLTNVMIGITYYYKKPWKNWRADLCQTYFRNPWAAISLNAAIVIFALTIIETVYTILQYYHQHDQSPSPTTSPSPFGIPIPRPWRRL